MRILLLSLLLLCGWFSQSVRAQSQSQSLSEALKANCRPLAGTDPATDDADLRFLDTVLADKTVIGLGESTHGTREFFRMKHRMIRYLAEHRGYRVFAIEASFAGCQAVNDFVMDGKGTAEEALRGIYFWTWQTAEVRDLLRWMRQFNSSRSTADKIQFWGFDMQHPMAGAKALMADLDRTAIDYSPYRQVLATLSEQRYNRADSTLADDYSKLQQLERQLAANQELFIRSLGSRRYLLDQQSLRILLQAVGRRQHPEDHFRDSCMAENIQWLSAFTGTDNIMIWAHNGHISKQGESDGTDFQMGHRLSKLFGSSYYAVGFDFSKGSFQAIRTRYVLPGRLYQPESCAISRIRKHSTNAVYAAVGLPLFFLDHQRAGGKSREVKQFLTGSWPAKVIGAIYWPKWERSYYHPIVPALAYDATIYVHETTPAVPL